jgi:hypothetical protein
MDGTCTVTGLASAAACTANYSSKTVVIKKPVTSTTSTSYSMTFKLTCIKMPGKTFTSALISVSIKNS